MDFEDGRLAHNTVYDGPTARQVGLLAGEDSLPDRALVAGVGGVTEPRTEPLDCPLPPHRSGCRVSCLRVEV
jgi:hypothetical protein